MMARPRLPPLADTLGALLPDVQDMLLLRTCLADAQTAAAAWKSWLALAPGLPMALVERPRSRRLLPLLHYALGRHGIALAEPLLAILRAAALLEERRAARIRAILVLALASLRRAGVAPVLLKGVALAETAYPQFRLRHCHDLDLLVAAEDLGAARKALMAAGFRSAAGNRSEREDGSSLALQLADGLLLNLHTRLWQASTSSEPLEVFRARARAIEFDGESVPVFAPMDMLLHVCGHAGCSVGLGSWIWIADAAMILGRHAPTSVDWAGIGQIAAQSGIALLLALRFADLAARFGLPIPDGVLDALVEAAWQSSSVERDAALSAARAASGASFVDMLRRCGWRSRLDIAGWALRRCRCRFQSG
jgi:hypothetical protein